ncbi:peroxide stress protein YaaA [Marinimicrobium sp. C6131]|uniref:peroxide stress protein YaaA n=1 Tax=Marinimicrobium sp. C6131 TaxID=3022676 RepID=UPI00223CD017|nr:peroxide stress protein YaaA [Marinimicrobium sp. C6131]UZJ43709.1 peroxide stress protein YaaA [Marinimicrobium sp. C6131]
MLMLISPAKTLDFETAPVTDRSTQPDFLDQSQELIGVLRDLAPQDISSLMGISDKLGQLNYDRYHQWQTPFTSGNAKQAALAFKGDVYTGLNAEQFKEGDFTFAQKHLRILSGLYGLLRPLDLIQPYRLEMGTRLSNPRGDNLYQFWGERLTRAINQQLDTLKSSVVVNLASNEYFKSVQPGKLSASLVTPVFKDWKNGQYKIISFYAKKARGLMAAYAIQNRIQDAEDLKAFDVDGYAYNDALSKGAQWVFTRDSA